MGAVCLYAAVAGAKTVPNPSSASVMSALNKRRMSILVDYRKSAVAAV